MTFLYSTIKFVYTQWKLPRSLAFHPNASLLLKNKRNLKVYSTLSLLFCKYPFVWINNFAISLIPPVHPSIGDVSMLFDDWNENNYDAYCQRACFLLQYMNAVNCGLFSCYHVQGWRIWIIHRLSLNGTTKTTTIRFYTFCMVSTHKIMEESSKSQILRYTYVHLRVELFAACDQKWAENLIHSNSLTIQPWNESMNIKKMFIICRYVIRKNAIKKTFERY